MRHEMQSLIFKLAILSFAFHNAPVFGCVGEPLVQMRGGKVRGAKQMGSEGDKFCAFKGIPYAKPPVGKLRFQDPELPEPWTGILETTAYSPICTQYDLFTSKLGGVEDCLYLNVYTKNVEPKIKRPVMFWIHGGCFVFGSGDDLYYGPDYFMRKDIVLVTINYRLGIFGFLNLNHELATGNQGLKDQVMALKWVRDNIANFGGDPDNVTIFGESAGGASVHYHTMSPLSKGLFHKAISQSGVALNPWAFHTSVKERSLRLSENLGHTDRNIQSVVQFLRTTDAQKIVKAQKALLTKEEKAQGVFTFGPTVDTKSKNPFLPVHPRIAATAGIQVPLMIGHNTREGLIFIKDFIALLGRFDSEFSELLHPDIASIMKPYGSTVEDLKQIYFKNNDIAKKNLDVLVDLYGDLYFIEGIHKVLKTQVEQSLFPTYFYQFTYDKKSSVMKVLFNTKMNGTAHADDLFFLFRAKFFGSVLKYAKKGSERYKLMEEMIDMWVNFATTGTPIPKSSELLPLEWQPVDNETIFPFINIGENLHMETVTSLEQKLSSNQKVPKNQPDSQYSVKVVW